MPHMTLTDEQVRVFESAGNPIEIRAPDGRVLATLTPPTPGEREIIKRWNPPGPRISTQTLLAVLARAEEIDQANGITPEKMADLLRQAWAGQLP
jgi:hypothetical protein